MMESTIGYKNQILKRLIVEAIIILELLFKN